MSVDDQQPSVLIEHIIFYALEFSSKYLSILSDKNMFLKILETFGYSWSLRNCIQKMIYPVEMPIYNETFSPIVISR